MPEVVGGHADLVALGRAHGRFQPRQVDGGVVDERVQRTPERVEGVDEGAHALLRAEVDLQQRMAIRGNALLAGDALGFVEIAASHDDEPVARGERLRGIEANARGGAGNDHGGA